MKDEEYVEMILKEARQIAESKFPEAIVESHTKEIWISGFVSGYLNRITEEIINKSK